MFPVFFSDNFSRNMVENGKNLLKNPGLITLVGISGTILIIN